MPALVRRLRASLTPEVVAGLAAIEGSDDDALKPGQVPASWARERLVGQGTLDGVFADIGHSKSLSYMRSVLASRLVHYGLHDLDAATIRLSAPRSFTQEISRFVFECTDGAGGRAHMGLEYASRLGDEFDNWVVFEPAVPASSSSDDIPLDDPDFVAALERLDLELVT